MYDSIDKQKDPSFFICLNLVSISRHCEHFKSKQLKLNCLHYYKRLFDFLSWFDVYLNGSEIDPIFEQGISILFAVNFRKSPRVLMMGSTRWQLSTLKNHQHGLQTHKKCIVGPYYVCPSFLMDWPLDLYRRNSEAAVDVLVVMPFWKDKRGVRVVTLLNLWRKNQYIIIGLQKNGPLWNVDNLLKVLTTYEWAAARPWIWKTHFQGKWKCSGVGF